MLEHLSVRDFALIDEAEVNLPEGLVIFTGETGAGKSLVVGAIGFLFGGRADSGLIREGAAECVVSANLDISKNASAKAWLTSHDIPDDGGAVILRRGLKSNGRSYAYIQNQSVSRADLADFTSTLADIHGQHEHQSLLDAQSHLELLDSFGDLENEREAYRLDYEAWTLKLREYRHRLSEAEKRSAEREMLLFSTKEIGSAKIGPNEDDELLQEEKILSQHEKLYEAVRIADDQLSSQGENSQAILAGIRKTRAELEAAGHIDPRLGEFAKRLESAYFEIEDIAGSVSAYREGLTFDPKRLEEIENRLAELRRLKKKYGPSLADVLARLQKDTAAIEEFSSWEEDRTELEKEIVDLKNRALEKAEALSQKRKSAASAFSLQVESILSRLGMLHALLPISLKDKRSDSGKLLLSQAGMDEVEFLIAPNMGESPKPLARIASGGELSRIALAIKAVLSSKDTVDTLIFDEIDAGIGGEVAVAVGSYLKNISLYKQVLCVTHLASIAVRADVQLKVDKKVEEGRTVTRIAALGGGDREEEIARMLAGDKEGSASLAHAADLLRRFNEPDREERRRETGPRSCS